MTLHLLCVMHRGGGTMGGSGRNPRILSGPLRDQLVAHSGGAVTTVALGRARRRRLDPRSSPSPARYPPTRARTMEVRAWALLIQVTIGKGGHRDHDRGLGVRKSALVRHRSRIMSPWAVRLVQQSGS